MKNILQISNYMYPNIGGIEQTAKDISDVFKDKDIKQKIICFNSDAKDDDYICKQKETKHDFIDGVEVIRCGCIAKLFSQSLSLTYFRELKKLLKEFKPDIVILHYPNPFVTSLLLPMLDKNVKLYVWWHTDIVKQRLIIELFNIQNEKLLKRANQVIATSPNYIKGSKMLFKYKDKCIVIPSCIRPERFKIDNHKVEEIKQKYQGKTICFAIGRHVKYKGLEYLIKAFDYLDDSFVLLIGGSGPLTNDLKQMAKDKDNIIFLGRVTDDDLAVYYKAIDIFCFSSITKNEAFGLSLAEAMYFEKPAITFNIDESGVNYVSLNEITGIECINKDSEAFAKAIKKISLDDTLYKQYSTNAKKRVEDNFLFDSFKEKINKFII